ncbi:MAG: tripartite tricarboxylate transporter TctB family protein [Rhizobiaceae bacterium]|nr:tripartite tricarboxylate transporter TctB family protein [Rhizobiaceae bacterium]
MITLSLRLVVATLLLVIGVAAFIIALGYDFGTAFQMGPGYFPVVLSGLLALLAFSEIISSLLHPEARSVEWRPMLAILAAIAGFAVAMLLFGMVPAFFVVVGLAALSEKRYGWLPALVLASVTSLASYLLFSRFLGMSMPLFQWGL